MGKILSREAHVAKYKVEATTPTDIYKGSVNVLVDVASQTST